MFYNKDNMEGLKELKDNSIDCMITDPPYGYSFMNKGWDKVLPSMETWKECLRVLKPGSFAFVMSAPRQDVLSRMIINLEDAGFKTNFTSIYWTYATGFPKAANIGKLVDKRLGAEREVIGKNPNERCNNNDITCFNQRLECNITTPSSPEAKVLDGSYAGFNPKPAVEVIIVAMKPLDQLTYVDQALSNGKGVTWLDDCRVPSKTDIKQLTDKNSFKKWIEFDGGDKKIVDNIDITFKNSRFPANLLVSDDVLNNGVISKSIGGNANKNSSKANTQVYRFKDYKNMHTSGAHYDNSGSFSRFFDLDAWWEAKIPELKKDVQKTFPFLLVPKASKNEKNDGLDNFEIKEISDSRNSGKAMGIDGKSKQPSRNSHPTVKPLKLMSYLITLGSRPGDIILDPYGGSGTTGIAAYQLDRDFILFESEPEYHEIAEARLKNEEKKKGGFDKW